MNKHSLHILLIASWYPSKENPTAGSFVQEQAHMLRDFGHQVTVIHPFMLGTFANAITKRSYDSFSDEDGIRVLRVGVVPPMPFFRGISYAYCFRKVCNAMKKFQLDPKDFSIIHSHAMFMGGVIGHKLSKEYNLPQVHTEHTSGFIFRPDQYAKHDLSLTKEVFTNCQQVFFVSKFAKEETLRNLGLASLSSCLVLPNLVDASFFETSSNVKPSPFSFLIIGDLIDVKNHQLLLEAWALMEKERSNLQLSIVGEGHLEESLKELAASLGLKNIVWLPRLNRAEVKEQMSVHQVILSASKVETFGLTIAEAQAMGKPVVVTDSGGVRDIVTQNTGIVTECSPEAFAKGLIHMIQSLDSFDPETIRLSAKNRFAAEVIMNQLNEIYRRLHVENLYL